MNAPKTSWRLYFLCAAALAALSVAVLAGPPNYPLAPGTRWTLHLHQEVGAGISFGEDVAPLAKGNVLDIQVVSEVTGSEAVGGKTYARIESKRNGKLWLREWYRLEPEGLLQGKSLDAETGEEHLMAPPQKLLSATLQPGEAWTWRAPDAPVTIHTRVLGPESVTVPAGHYSATKLEVATTVPVGNSLVQVQQYRWFVPGVGYVRQQTESRAGTRLLSRVELALERFQAAAPSR